MQTKPQRLDIFIKEDMDVSHRASLVARLEEETGIVGAWFESGSHHRLIVHYQREYFSQLTLLDTIKRHGLHGEVVAENQ